MGRVLKAVVLVVGLVSFGLGSWVIGVICIAYVLFSSRSVKSRGSSSAVSNHSLVSKKMAASVILVSLALVAFVSGGTYSPMVFVSFAALVFLSPLLSSNRGLSRVVPVDESILLRSRLFPLVWHTVAEVKPGSEDLPRALSSFTGNLIVTKEGRAFTYSTFFAFDFKSAQNAADIRLKAATNSIPEGGAYLLPVDSKTACELLSWKLVPLKSEPRAYPVPGADVVALEAEGNYVKRMRAYRIGNLPNANPVLPNAERGLERGILLWDFLQFIGRIHPWQEPDSYSSLLQSIRATASEPISHRFNGIDGSAESVTVQSLGGDRVPLTRAQLRAILALNS